MAGEPKALYNTSTQHAPACWFPGAYPLNDEHIHSITGKLACCPCTLACYLVAKAVEKA